MDVRMFSQFLIFNFLSAVTSTFLIQSEIDIFGFEKSVAYILKKESNETGNNFVVLIHSLNSKDCDLDALVREINKNDIALTMYSQSMSFYT